jgi:hypothetical protein
MITLLLLCPACAARPQSRLAAFAIAAMMLAPFAIAALLARWIRRQTRTERERSS